MTILQTRVFDPTSARPDDVDVVISAHAPGGGPVVAPGGLIVGPSRPTPDATGLIAVDLFPTQSLSPFGSWYSLETRVGRDSASPALFGMPGSGGPFSIEEVLLVPPSLAFPAQIQHVTPRILTGSTSSDYAEINYGTSPAALDLRYRWDGVWVDFQVMVRCGSGASFGTAGKSFALELPIPADIGVGNGVACLIGDATLGHGFGGHVRAGLHTGRVGDLTNGAFAFFVPEKGPGSFAVANNFTTAAGDGPITDWTDFHIRGSYPSAP